MSQRAIKKRDNFQLYQKQHPRHKKFIHQKKTNTDQKIKISQNSNLKRSNSYPCVQKKTTETDLYSNNHQLRSKSLSDVSKLSKMNSNRINAKSEVCLVKISEHSTNSARGNQNIYTNKIKNSTSDMNLNYDQLSARSCVANSTGGAINQILREHINSNNNSSNTDRINNNTGHLQRARRMSQPSSVYSINSSSALSPSECENHGFADTSGVRIPIIGYEIMEERARFTVYKLRVENPFTNDCWLVLRRYTDFVRLHNKLKQTFPQQTINLQLPKKKIFGDNFNSVFLDNRVQGLQIFVNSIMANEILKNSKMVRDFFCLDEPPSYSESMEECRAIFEAQEETITHLKLQINSKNDMITTLQQKFMNEVSENERLKTELKKIAASCTNCRKTVESFHKTQ